MKSLPALIAVAGFALSISGALADSKSEVADGIKKLADQPNYSWTSTPKVEGTKAGRNQGPLDGKTEKSGLTYLKGTSGDNAYEAAFKGEKLVVNYTGDWIAPSELPVDDGRIEARLKALKVTPVEEAGKLLAKVKELKKGESGEYTGELDADTAKAAFAVLGRRAAEAPEAKGTIKVWLKDGRLAKYEFKIEGKITTGADKKEVEISRTTTVEIKDVGSTKISLPDDATKRLS
jgi:hypothetical protein